MMPAGHQLQVLLGCLAADADQLEAVGRHL
jgi:hypothetical protein